MGHLEGSNVSLLIREAHRGQLSKLRAVHLAGIPLDGRGGKEVVGCGGASTAHSHRSHRLLHGLGVGGRAAPHPTHAPHSTHAAARHHLHGELHNLWVGHHLHHLVALLLVHALQHRIVGRHGLHVLRVGHHLGHHLHHHRIAEHRHHRVLLRGAGGGAKPSGPHAAHHASPVAEPITGANIGRGSRGGCATKERSIRVDRGLRSRGGGGGRGGRHRNRCDRGGSRGRGGGRGGSGPHDVKGNAALDAHLRQIVHILQHLALEDNALILGGDVNDWGGQGLELCHANVRRLEREGVLRTVR